MRAISILTVLALTLFAIEYKKPYRAAPYAVSHKERVEDLEYQKVLETYMYLKDRYETLKKLHPHNHKDLKESELKCKLAHLDLLIAKIKLGVNLNEEGALK
jgi:hypothetical protein